MVRQQAIAATDEDIVSLFERALPLDVDDEIEGLHIGITAAQQKLDGMRRRPPITTMPRHCFRCFGG